MTENELGLLSSVELERKKFLPNVVNPVAGSPSVERNTASFQVQGTATGGGSAFIAVRLEGVDVLMATTSLETAVVAAGNFRSILSSALVSAYGSNQYVVGGSGPNVNVLKLNGTELWVEDYATTDATQSIIQTAGTRVSNSVLLEATAAGAGLPRRYEDGYFINTNIPTDNRVSSFVLHTMLKNLTGSPVQARFRVWFWYDYLGWTGSSVNTISEATGTGIEEQTSNFTATGARKVAVELIDNGTASTPLPAGSAFTTMMINSH